MTTHKTTPKRTRTRSPARRPAGKYLVITFMVVSLGYFIIPLIWLFLSST